MLEIMITKPKRLTVLYVVSGLLVFMSVFYAFSVLFDRNTSAEQVSVVATAHPELEAARILSESRPTFEALVTFFQTIAREKGGVYAFDVMREAALPPDTDTHLLGHVIGDELYTQEGIDGMGLCTHDFRNACSHTMVIGALLEYGEGAYSLIQDACARAPGGSGAYTMCFHGLGHGVLAFNDYDFKDAVTMCREFGTEMYDDQEVAQCVGGAVMEMIGGGGHNETQWEKMRTRYLTKGDPLSLCRVSYLTENERWYCYTYLTPFIFESIDANEAHPSPEDFRGAFAICDTIPAAQPENRHACFGGLGKEFVGLAAGRDYRGEQTFLNTAYKDMRTWCEFAAVEDGIEYCNDSVVGSLYWGGENAYSLPLTYCSGMEDDHFRGACYVSLILNVAAYVEDRAYREEFCNTVPADQQMYCTEELL